MTTVTDQAELLAALEAASPAGGTTIDLNLAGEMAGLNLRPNTAPWAVYDAPVIIRSLNPASPAVIREILTVRGCKNIQFHDVYFKQDQQGSTSLDRVGFKVDGNSSRIQFHRCTFDGNYTTGDLVRVGIALEIDDASHILVNDCDIFDFGWGIRSTGGTSGVIIANNDIHDLRVDYLHFTVFSHLLIEGNYLYDPHELGGTHVDMFQSWQPEGTPNSHDLRIYGNIFDAGSGDATQTIHMTSISGTPNTVVEHNVIHNAHINAIRGGINRYNTLLWHQAFTGDGLISKPRIVDYELSEFNIEPDYGSVPAGNLPVVYGTPSDPNSVENLFVNALAGAAADPLVDLLAKAGTPIFTSGYGADMTRTGVRHRWHPKMNLGVHLRAAS